MVLWETTFGLFITRQERGLSRKSQKHLLKNMNNACLYFLSIYKLISEWTKEKSKSQVCAVQALLKEHKKQNKTIKKKKTGQLLGDVQQCHQLRTGRNQRDPGTIQGRLAKKWSSWKSCSQKARPLTWKQGQETQPRLKWGAEKQQHVLWTDNSKFEICACSRRKFGLWSGTITSVCR